MGVVCLQSLLDSISDLILISCIGTQNESVSLKKRKRKAMKKKQNKLIKYLKRTIEKE